MPERFQLQRRRGFRLPSGGRSVARPGRYGNPFGLTRLFTRDDPLRPYLDAAVLEVLGIYAPDLSAPDYTLLSPVTKGTAVAAHRLWLLDQPELIAMARRDLAGRDLGCWCPVPEPGEPDICHGRNWLVVANDLEVSWWPR